MKVVRLIVALLLVLTWTAAASAQGWRGLLPMRSTCQDVERVLGGAACGKEQAIYDLPGESVWFNFSVDGCKGDDFKKGTTCRPARSSVSRLECAPVRP